MYGEERIGTVPPSRSESSRLLSGIQHAQSLVSEIFDKLSPVLVYRGDKEVAGIEKDQSSVLSEVGMLNRRLEELLKNIDL